MEAICLDSQPHILLAEDDSELRDLLSFALTRAGYLVTCCDNGLDLLERLLQPQGFDLVISDLRMPALSGIEVLERLQGKKLPPLVCMTAFGEPLLHAHARSLGATATIDKPFDLDEMIGLVHTTRLQNNDQTTFSGVNP